MNKITSTNVVIYPPCFLGVPPLARGRFENFLPRDAPKAAVWRARRMKHLVGRLLRNDDVAGRVEHVDQFARGPRLKVGAVHHPRTDQLVNGHRRYSFLVDSPRARWRSWDWH